MNIKNYVINLYKGRLSRSEFLKSLIILFLLNIFFAVSFVGIMSIFRGPVNANLEIAIFFAIFAIYFLVAQIIIFSLFVRRLHDIGEDKEAYLVALFVPIVNIIFLLFIFLKASKDTFRNPKRTLLSVLLNNKDKTS